MLSSIQPDYIVAGAAHPPVDGDGRGALWIFNILLFCLWKRKFVPNFQIWQGINDLSVLEDFKGYLDSFQVYYLKGFTARYQVENLENLEHKVLYLFIDKKWNTMKEDF